MIEPRTPYSAPTDSEPRNDIQRIADDIHRQIETRPMSYKESQDLYSFDRVGNIGVDNRLPTTIYDIDSRDVYDPLSDGTLISRYKNYMPGTDNEERLAQQQSTGEKWKNGWIKLAGKTGTSVIGGTVGTVNGIIQAISQGSISAAFDNDFNSWLDDLNMKMDYRLPNYYTQQEQNYSLARQMWTANFWADEVFQGLSFTLGMLVSEGIWAAATGGTSLVARGLSAGALRTLSKNLGRSGANKVLNAHKQIGKNLINKNVSKTALAGVTGKQAIDAGMQATTRAGRIIDLFHKGRVIVTSSAYEGGVEARHYMMEAEEDYIQNFLRVNGRRPTGIELADFRNNITNSANAVFASNIALVGATNLAVFGRALLGTRNTGTFKNNWFKDNILGVGYRKEGAKIVTKEATKAQKIASKTYDILRPMFAEGVIEEGGQSIISETAKNYMLSAYDPDSTAEAISFIDALHEGFSDTFGTKEGQKEILIGSIIGIIGGGFQTGYRFNDTSRQRKNLEDLAKYHNAFTAENLLNNVIYNNKAKYAAQMTDEAIQNGDRIGGEIGNDAALVAKIERDYAFEGVEQGFQDFAAYMRGSIDTIMQELNMTESEAQNFIDEQVEAYKNFSDEYVKNREFAETVYGVTEFAEFENSGLVRENVVRAVASIMTIGKNADLRATETIKEIQELIRDRVSTTEAHRSLAVADALRKAGRNAHERYMRASNRLHELDIQLEKVRNKVAELNQHTDMSEAQAEQRAKLVQRMIELEEKVKVEQATKLAAYNALNLKSVSDENITQEDLDNQKKNYKDLQRSLRALEGSDSVLFNEVQQKYNEYGRAVDYAKAYLESANRMLNPETRFTELNNYAKRLFSKKAKLKVSEAAFFEEMIEKWGIDNIGATFVAQEQQDTQSITEEDTDTQARPEEESIEPKEKVKTQEDTIREELDTLEFDPESKRFRTNRQILPARINTRKRAQKYVRDSYKEGFSERIGITEEEFQNFVDTGQTTPDIIEYLAEKGYERPGELTPQEQDMYNALTEEINAYLSNKFENTVIESLKAIREKIRDLINNNAYTKLYRGESLEEMAKSQPSQEDMDTYQKYLERLDREDIDTINRYQDYTPLEEKGFSEEEIDDFVELSLNLGEWYILEGISEGGNSVADLLMLMEQYQMQADSLGISTELSLQDYVEVKKSPDDVSSRYNSSNPIQTPDKVKIKLVNGKYEISHLNINSLEGLIPGATVQKINKKGELEDINPNDIYNEGDKYKITLEDQSTIIEIGPHSRLIVEKNSFDSIIENSNIRVVNYGSNINFDMYVRPDVDSEFIPLQGDFFDAGINPEISSEVEVGDIVHLEIDTNNPFNKQLIKKIKRTKNESTKKKLIGQLLVYTKTESGEGFGQLRAFHERLSNNSSTSKLIEIRDNAYKAIEAGETGIIDLGYRVPVANTLLGSPNFVVVEEADGTLRPTTKEITPEMMKTIKAAGVYSNGKLELNDKKVQNNTNTFFLRGLEGEVPVVVFEFKGKSIAFPVSLKKTTTDHSGRLAEVDSNMGTAQQIISINNILIENGINPYDYQLDPSSSLKYGENAEVLRKIENLLRNVENFADINAWKSQNFDVSLLAEQAETYIDMSNDPFDSSKVILSLSEAKVVEDNTDVMKEVFEGTETIKPKIVSETLKNTVKKNQPEENC